MPGVSQTSGHHPPPDSTTMEKHAATFLSTEPTEAWPLATPAYVAELQRAHYETFRRELLATMPETPGVAMQAAHMALLDWRSKSNAALAAAIAFNTHDVLGSALRVQCVEELQRDVLATDVPANTPKDWTPVARKGLSASAAQTAASNHPLYVEHKAKARELGETRDATANAAEQAHETLLNLRAYLPFFMPVHVADTLPGVAGSLASRLLRE